MIKIVKESTVKTYSYSLEGEDNVRTDFIEQYCYDSEEGKIRHKQIMESNGFYVKEQVRENIGSVGMPLYVWFVKYHKSEYNYTTSALAYLNKRLHAGKVNNIK